MSNNAHRPKIDTLRCGQNDLKTSGTARSRIAMIRLPMASTVVTIKPTK